MNKVVAVIFSYNRALQCDLIIKSLKLHCKDYQSLDVKVLYKFDSSFFQSYQLLEKEYPEIEFIKEYKFRQNVSDIILSHQYVMYLTDDSIFIDDFTIEEILKLLVEEEQCLGFSLRLGLNTEYCYSMNTPQLVPTKIVSLKNKIMWDWKESELDFAYPWECSSSLYRSSDSDIFLSFPWKNPNEMEWFADQLKFGSYDVHPLMASFKKSVCFANPLNKVNERNKNRASSIEGMDIFSLQKKFEEGYRADPEQFNGFMPLSCHQEVKLELKKI